MYISKLNISNYRSLKKTSINCEKELSLIIGKNNCGKTSLLSILNKCIGSKSDVGNFEYFDFSISFQKKFYEVIKGADSFGENELTGIRLDMYIEYDEDDNLANISKLMLDLDPNNKTIVLRFDYTINIKLDKLREDFENYKNDRKHLIIEEDAFIKFISKNHKKYFEFNQYSVLYNYKKGSIDNKIFKILDKKDGYLSKIISFSYISAKRNVDNSDDAELSTLSSTYYEKTKNPNEGSSTVLEFEKQVDDTDKEFDKIYLKVFENLIGKISKFGGIKKDDTNLKIISQIHTSKLLKDNTTVVYDDESNFLPEHYNGLGYLNLISMIIKMETLLSNFRKDTKEDEEPADINLLFIEEPEAHTHPQMQYVFIKNIKDLLKEGKKIKDSDKEINLQTFMTTHSSHIVAESNFDDIKYFVKVKDGGGCNTVSKNLKELETLYQKERGKDNNHFKFLKQYLTLNRSEIFFADKVILIEGDTERILLPAMIKKLDQENKYEIPLLSQNISIIEVGNYSEIYSKFIQFIGTKTLIITDIDTAVYEPKIESGAYKLTKTIPPKRIYELKKQKVKISTFSTNSSLKYFFFNDASKIRTKWLTSINKKQKILSNKNNKWSINSLGELMVVYQTYEVNYDGKGYNARSFEDAFFHINRKLFTDFDGANDTERIEKCAISFQGLKNVGYFFDNSKDSYDLAESCVNKKPSLAMDILLNSKSEGEKDFINWKIPAYIKEGLEWLQQD